MGKYIHIYILISYFHTFEVVTHTITTNGTASLINFKRCCLLDANAARISWTADNRNTGHATTVIHSIEKFRMICCEEISK